MRARDNLRSLLALALVGLGGAAVLGQAPEVILHPISRIPESVLLSIRPHTTSWVLLEASPDLATWHAVANVLTTNSSVPFVDYPGSNALVRFYRVRSPGVTVAEALSSWQARRPTHYQYSFQNTKLETGGVILVATVTISNGVKTLTNVTANGFPTTTFDPADFLTPDEVFSLISEVEAHGVKLAHVTYDESWGFPSAVLVIGGTSTQMTDYRISEFSELLVRNRSPNKITAANPALRNRSAHL